jgi:hypothetical protein
VVAADAAGGAVDAAGAPEAACAQTDVAPTQLPAAMHRAAHITAYDSAEIAADIFADLENKAITTFFISQSPQYILDTVIFTQRRYPSSKVILRPNGAKKHLATNFLAANFLDALRFAFVGTQARILGVHIPPNSLFL